MKVETVDIAERVLRHLETLKYLGGQNESGQPSGEGIPIRLIVLPDLLVDFRKCNLEPGSGNVCTVGGRAARVACSLLDLLNDEDGTFSVHLLTKTGVIGKVVLENAFRKHEASRMAMACFETVKVNEEHEPRWALLPGKGIDFIAAAADPGKELGPMDLADPAIRSFLQQATGVYLSTIKSPHFNGLFSRLLDVLVVGQPFFIDAARGVKENGDAKHVGDLVRALKSRSNTGNAGSCSTLFVPADMEAHLTKAAGTEDIPGVCRTLAVSAVCYGGDGVAFHDMFGNTSCRVPTADAHFEKEGNAERFKAGVLLACALSARVTELAQGPAQADTHDILSSMAREWEAPVRWDRILRYGLHVTSNAKAGELPDAAKSDGSMNAGRNENMEGPVAFGADRVCKGAKSLTLRSETQRPIFRLAEMRRRRRLNIPDLARCREGVNRCEDCPSKTHSDEFIGAVMIDLDGTLMNSTEQRNRGLTLALGDLNRSLVKLQESRTIKWLADFALKESTEASVRFFADFVYDNWRAFLNLGIQDDFRQDWNLPGWYAMYILLASREEYNKYTPEFAELRDANRPFRKPEWSEQLVDEYSRIRQEYNAEIQAARQAFVHARIFPFKEARDFLCSLKMAGYKLYVVSEGRSNTQWEKIERSGLSDFFDRRRVLTTDDAATPKDETKALEQEFIKLFQRMKALQDKQGEFLHKYEAVSGLRFDVGATSEDVWKTFEAGLKALIDEGKRKKDELREVEKDLKLADFLRVVLKRMSVKDGLPFYAAVVRAILRNPDNPLSVLTSFRKLMAPLGKPRKIKFAMVGDRLEKDIVPPTTLLGTTQLLTIRLLSGKYHEEKGPFESTYVARTLAQTKLILLTNKAWHDEDSGRIRCADDPPAFSWDVDMRQRDYFPDRENDNRVGFALIDRGLSMPWDQYETIPRICTEILAEHFRRHPKQLPAALQEYAAMKITSDADARTRLRKLCRLIDSGIFEPTKLGERQTVCVRNICSDLKFLQSKAACKDLDVRAGIELLNRFAKWEDTEAGKIAKEFLDKY